MTTRELAATAEQAVQLAHYSTGLAAAAVELAAARREPRADDVAIATALLDTATAIQTLAAALIDRDHQHGDIP